MTHPMMGAIWNAMAPPEQLGKSFVNGFGVSTVNSHDLGWETAVCREGGKWHPVERYFTREEAEAGHVRWQQRAEAGLTTVLDLGYPDYVDAEEVEL